MCECGVGCVWGVEVEVLMCLCGEVFVCLCVGVCVCRVRVGGYVYGCVYAH